MKKEDLATLGQLLSGMKDALAKVEEAQKKKDGDLLASAKKEILIFQGKIAELL